MWSPGNKFELKLSKLKKFVRNYFISKTGRKKLATVKRCGSVAFPFAGCVLHVR